MIYLIVPHLALAAALAISDLLLADRDSALALPPFFPPNFPRATAAEFLPSEFKSGSLFSPVAISTMDLALWFISVGRFDFAMKQIYKIRCLFAQAFGEKNQSVE